MTQLKYYFVTTLLFMIATYVMGQKTYYGKITATSIGKNGQVAVSTSVDKPTSFSSSKSTTGSKSSTSSSVTIDLYLHAKANENYYFAGWSKNQDGTSIIDRANPYKISTTATSTNKSSPTNGGTYYATFNETQTYDCSIMNYKSETFLGIDSESLKQFSTAKTWSISNKSTGDGAFTVKSMNTKDKYYSFSYQEWYTGFDTFYLYGFDGTTNTDVSMYLYKIKDLSATTWTATKMFGNIDSGYYFIVQNINNEKHALGSPTDYSYYSHQILSESGNNLKLANSEINKNFVYYIKITASNRIIFDKYKSTKKSETDTLAKEGDSQAVLSLISTAKSDIEKLTYDEHKSLDDNKAIVDTIISKLKTDIMVQRTEDKLAEDKAVFETYKTTRKADAEALAKDGDSQEASKLISEAINPVAKRRDIESMSQYSHMVSSSFNAS